MSHAATEWKENNVNRAKCGCVTETWIEEDFDDTHVIHYRMLNVCLKHSAQKWTK